MITPVFNHEEPIYRQLYRALRAEILAGRLMEGEKLPSKRILSNHLNISVNTVMAAYRQLLDEGYLMAKERSGFYVAPLEKLPLPLRPEPLAVAQKAPSPRYNLLHHGIAPQSFPKDAWRRITRDLLRDDTINWAESGDLRGDPRLRNEIARYLYRERGLAAHPDTIFVRSGLDSLLPLVFQLLEKPPVVALESPGYARMERVLDAYGVVRESRALDEHGMTVDAASPANVLLITPSHQFPTGIIMPVGRRQEHLGWARDHDGYIIEDDYDSEFKYSGAPIPAMKSLDADDRILYMGTFSKCLSPALRVSYMVLPCHLAERAMAAEAASAPTVSILTQQVLATLLESGDFERHLHRMKTHYRKKRAATMAALRRWSLPYLVHGADAGLHLYLTLPEVELRPWRHMIEEKGVALTVLQESPATFLIGYGAEEIERQGEAIRILGEVLAAMVK